MPFGIDTAKMATLLCLAFLCVAHALGLSFAMDRSRIEARRLEGDFSEELR